VIPRALRAARAAAEDYESAGSVLSAARGILAYEPNVIVDYLVLTTPDLVPLTDGAGAVQERPVEQRPAQDRPAQDRPAQDRPVQAYPGRARPARILVAAAVGGTRLIDNMHLELAPLQSAVRVPSGEA
jgi:pantothenate synthetase